MLERLANKYIRWLVEKAGYKLIKNSEYDKLKYEIHHKSSHKVINIITAEDMKVSMLKDVENPIIFDVGAYIGNTVKAYLEYFPKATIYAFEPTPLSYTEIAEKFRDIKNVKCFQKAITDSNSNITFNVNEFSPTNSILSTDAKASHYWGDNLLDTVDIVSVSSTTLDDICEKENIGNIDILKLDVQGAELKALTGAENLLTENRIRIIYLEMIMVPTYKGQASYYEIGKYLGKKGYTLKGIFNLTYGKQLKQADMIYSKDQIK